MESDGKIDWVEYQEAVEEIFIGWENGVRAWSRHGRKYI